ncbi:MAG: Hsp70 family protein [Caldilineaceae bacterium]|nr:Hsp70 family protein [Caldilineaceae bacterium]
MWLGIDFGTTNTSAAVYDGNKLDYIPLDPHNSSEYNLRSMIYVDNQHRVRLGVDAVQTFLREDTGRPVVLEEKVVGTIENTVASQGFEPGEQGGPITIIYDVLIDEDVAIRGRLLQSIKTGLRSAAYQGTKIFGRYYTIEELIAFILRHVRQRSEQILDQPARQALIGRPVTFSHDPAVDQLAEEKIRRAAHLAGFAQVDFLPEPVAAAAFYANRTSHEQTLLVFDFGGGTLDLTVLKVSAAGQQQVLASLGILVGGDDLDSAIMRGKVAPYFGTQSAIDVNFDGRLIPFPEHLAELLEQWQTIPTLTRPENLQIIRRGIQYGNDRAAFQALETLATQNYGFALFQAIEQAKRELSQQAASTIRLQLAEVQLAVELLREEFNGLIGTEQAEVRRGIREAIAAAGLNPEQVEVVVATGGSSAIPAFQALLRREIPGAEIVVSDPFGSVTGGLAIHAYQHQLASA